MAEWVRAEGGRGGREGGRERERGREAGRQGRREGGREGGREEVSGGGIERERKGAWEQGRGKT